jgi:hypothetical protein
MTKINEDIVNSINSESTSSDFGKKRIKKSYAKKPIKNGEWDRNEVVKFFTCNTIYYKYEIPWKYLIKYVQSRTVQQVYNKIKISQEAIKYVNKHFWKEHSVADFVDMNSVDKDYDLLFQQIQKKNLIFLSQNSKNIFHTKKQKLNSIPKIQKHLFTFSETDKVSEKSEDLNKTIMPIIQRLCNKISIEICNEDYSTFLNLNRNSEDPENTIKIDYRSFKQFLLHKSKSEI